MRHFRRVQRRRWAVRGRSPTRPELPVVSLPATALLPHAKNARTHSSTQVAQIAAPIAEFGFVNPVLVDGEGVLIAGHGRVMAAKKTGVAALPVLRRRHLSQVQARAVALRPGR